MTKRYLFMAVALAGFTSLQIVGSASQAPQVPAPQLPVPIAPSATQPLPSPCGTTRAYSGAPIDVDFQGSDLRTTLRLLADTGGINLVLDPSLPENGTVDVKLTQVPWDQVLDVVLRASQLTCVPEG